MAAFARLLANGMNPPALGAGLFVAPRRGGLGLAQVLGLEAIPLELVGGAHGALRMDAGRRITGVSAHGTAGAGRRGVERLRSLVERIHVALLSDVRNWCSRAGIPKNMSTEVAASGPRRRRFHIRSRR